MQFSFPSQCTICRTWAHSHVCDACLQNHIQTTQRCTKCAVALPEAAASTTHTMLCGVCMQAKHLPHIDASFAAVSYAFPWQDSINAFKFNDAIGYSNTLADIMLNHPALLRAVLRANVLIPMPLHTSRLAERGYNQSLLLARSLSKRARTLATVANNHCMVHAHYLQRTRATAVQNQLPIHQRQRNVRGAFAVPKDKQPYIHQQDVALIDDVLTTGASANAAASALKAAGARTVVVLVFARTEKD